MRKISLIALLLIGMLSSVVAQTEHFVPIWAGENGFSHMNIYVPYAIVDDEVIQPGDEIGVFSGDICVGSQIVTVIPDTNDYTTMISIIVSMDDGTGNGFVQGDTILYKVYDKSLNTEADVLSTSYYNDISFWTVDAKFISGGSAFVNLEARSIYTQIIGLQEGWNKISTYLELFEKDIELITEDLKNYNELVKVQAQTGLTYEYWSWGNLWHNGIGPWDLREGYNIKVNSLSIITLRGYKIQLPYSIELEKGWNLIPAPYDVPVDALIMIQPLIDAGVFIKMMDEKGQSIIDIEGVGLVNDIVTIMPGQGYMVRVSENTTFTYTEQ